MRIPVRAVVLLIFATLAVSAVLVGGFFLRRSPIGSSSCRGAKQVVECSTEDYACETSRTERRSSQILRQSRTGRFAATRRPKRVCTSSVLASARISGTRPAERVLYSVHAVVQRCWQMQNGQPLQLVRYAISRRSTMLQSHIAAPQSTAIVIARVYTPPNCCKKLTARRMFARGAIAPLGQSTLDGGTPLARPIYNTARPACRGLRRCVNRAAAYANVVRRTHKFILRSAATKDLRSKMRGSWIALRKGPYMPLPRRTLTALNS